MSDLLTPAQIAEIRERCDTVTINGERPPGVFGSVHDLLRHAAAQAARIERLRKACEDVVKFDPSGDGPGWMFLMDQCARAISPAPAEPQEPLTGLTTLKACYCSKCGYLMPWAHKRSIDLLPLCAGCQLAASEPGVQLSTKDNPAKVDSSPAPASTPAFDAKAWAEKMVPRDKPFRVKPSDLGPVAGQHLKDDDGSGQHRADMVRDSIAAALTAAHAAGRAEGCPKPRKWPEGWQGAIDSQVLRWESSLWTNCGARWMRPGDWWLPQPAAPDAKEADHD